MFRLHRDKILWIKAETAADVWPQWSAMVAAKNFRRSLYVASPRHTCARVYFARLGIAIAKVGDYSQSKVRAGLYITRLVLISENFFFAKTVYDHTCVTSDHNRSWSVKNINKLYPASIARRQRSSWHNTTVNKTRHDKHSWLEGRYGQRSFALIGAHQCIVATNTMGVSEKSPIS